MFQWRLKRRKQKILEAQKILPANQNEAEISSDLILKPENLQEIPKREGFSKKTQTGEKKCQNRDTQTKIPQGTFSCQVQPTQSFSTTQTIAQKVSNIKTQTFTKTHSIGIQTENESENSFDLTNITKLDPEATFDLSLSLRKVELSQQVKVPAAPTEEELENNYQQIKTQREIEGNSEINDSILELLFKKRDQILSDINLIETALDIIN